MQRPDVIILNSCVVHYDQEAKSGLDEPNKSIYLRLSLVSGKKKTLSDSNSHIELYRVGHCALCTSGHMQFQASAVLITERPERQVGNSDRLFKKHSGPFVSQS